MRLLAILLPIASLVLVALILTQVIEIVTRVPVELRRQRFTTNLVPLLLTEVVLILLAIRLWF